MDYALANINGLQMNTLEEIKNALINDKKFYASEEVLDDFIKSLRGVTDATKESYYKGAKQFIEYCYKHNIEEVEEQDITNYFNFINANYKATTINMYVTSLRALYKYLAKKGIKNLASDLKGAKNNRNPKKDPLTKEQVLELLRSIDRTTEEGKRNYALLTLLIHTGLRTIEIERANIEDLRTLGTKFILQVQGKGHHEKDDYIKLTLVVYEAILDYLSIRKDAKPSDPLFISYSDRSKGERLKTRSIREIVKNSLRAIGINNPRITTHSLRHTAITFSLLGGASLQEAQLLARHTNINTTLIYAHNLDKLNSDYERSIDNYLES